LVLGKYRPISWHEKRSRYQGKGATGGEGGGSSGGCCSPASFGSITAAAAIDDEEKRWRDDDGEEEVDIEAPEAGAAALAGKREGDPEAASIGGCRGGWLILSGRRPLPSSFEEALEGRAANGGVGERVGGAHYRKRWETAGFSKHNASHQQRNPTYNPEPPSPSFLAAVFSWSFVASRR
jgi:hypothetical protein